MSEPKITLQPLSETPVTIEDDILHVELTDIGEGLHGDFNENDPTDKHMLRFYVTYKPDTITDDMSVLDDEGWVEIEDASYCTNLPDDTSMKTLKIATQIIFREYRKVIENYPATSVKKLGERLSWLSPEDVEKCV